MRVFVLAAIALVCRLGSAAETLTYTLTPHPDRGTLTVELSWQTANRTHSELSVSPHWGDVADVPALLSNMQFTGASNSARDGGHWSLDHNVGARIGCTYQVAPSRHSFEWDGTHYPITSRKFFHGMGNAFLVTPPTGDKQEVEALLRWKLPTGWKAACSWGSGPSIGATITSSDLRHSTYLAGELTSADDSRDGHTVTVALAGEFGFSAGDFANLASTTIAGQCAFMGEKSFPHFLVTVIPVGQQDKAVAVRLAGAGLYNSFALFITPGAPLTDAVEHLFAHELFHYWNGRMLRGAEPDELVYWFTEGLSDYYALRILYESGQWKAETYAKWINRHLREYAANPAAEASNDEIRAKYHSQRDTVGEAPYERGLALGLRWQRMARDHGVRDGFDKLFKSLVQRGRVSGYELTNESVRQSGIEQLGAWFGPEFDRHVTRAQRVEIPTDALAPDFRALNKPTYEFDLGFDRERSLADQHVRGLRVGSAAENAGLREGDALASWKLGTDPEQELEVKVLRGARVLPIRYLPRGKRTDALQFEPAPPKSPRSAK